MGWCLGVPLFNARPARSCEQVQKAALEEWPRAFLTTNNPINERTLIKGEGEKMLTVARTSGLLVVLLLANTAEQNHNEAF